MLSLLTCVSSTATQGSLFSVAISLGVFGATAALISANSFIAVADSSYILSNPKIFLINCFIFFLLVGITA
jgi:hypothetical protein